MPLFGEMTGKNKTIGAVAAVLILVSVVVIIRTLNPRIPTSDLPKKAYYTVDDGANFFEDEIGKIAPFQHDGKDAVLAHVYSNDGGATKKVLALEKYSPEDVQKKEAMLRGDPNITDEPSPLLKSPGANQRWLRPGSPQYNQLQSPGDLGENQGWVEIWPK